MRSALNQFLKIIFVALLLVGLSDVTFAASDETTADTSSDQSADPSTAATTVTTTAPAVAPANATTTTTQQTTTTTTTPNTTAVPGAVAPSVTTPAASAPSATTSPATTLEKALSPSETKAAYDQLLANAGVTYTVTKPNLDITIDEKKAIDALPRLEQQGMINGKIPASDVASMPISISGALIGVSFSAVIIHTEFESDISLDKLHIQVFLLPTGSVSPADKKLCYSFDFTRALFNKTNWDTVTPKDIMLNSPNFKFSEWCQTAIDKESNVKQ